MDRVSRGAGDGGHDVALLAQQGVGHRRLAHVGTPDDGDARQLLLLVRSRFGRQSRQNGVHQIARAAARHGTDAKGIAQTEGVELVRRIDLVVVVDLVADQQHFFAAPAQNVGHQGVEVGDAGRNLDKKENDVGLVDGQHHLAADFVLEDVFRIDRVTARVDHRKLLAVPVGLAVVAVARGAGRRVDDGFALADQAVEEGALAHVRASYDCYEAHAVSFYGVRECKDRQFPAKSETKTTYRDRESDEPAEAAAKRGNNDKDSYAGARNDTETEASVSASVRPRNGIRRKTT